MKLTNEQLARFDRDGFLVLPNLFSVQEVAIIEQRLAALFAEQSEANVREKHSGQVRTAMGLHLRDEVFAKLVRHPRFLEPAMQIAGDQLYVQQVKVNVKASFSGEQWQWHEDFSTHHHDDGVPEPRALNLHVFLDDVNEFNGPLYFIPGSHKHGPAPATLDTTTTSYPLWVLDKATVQTRVAQGGLFSAKGPAGTGLIFGDCMIHGSPVNMSPWDRRIFSLIVNSVTNALRHHRRPDHKHHRDLIPIVPLADDCLLTGVGS